MKTLIIIISITASLWAITISGSAPICKVNNSGTMAFCYYYSMRSCEASAGPGWHCVMPFLNFKNN